MVREMLGIIKNLYGRIDPSNKYRGTRTAENGGAASHLPTIWVWGSGKRYVQCESKKIPPYGFLEIFPKRLGIFNQFFTHLLCDHFYTRLLIFI